MEVVKSEEILVRAEGKMLLGAGLMVFLSFQLSNSPLYLLLLWCTGAGVLCAYILFRVLPRAPNFLLHIKHPSRLPPSPSSFSSLHPLSCPVCFQLDCDRHGAKKRRIKMNPWDDLTVPYSVDAALAEILEIVMQRYVYSWHRRLAPSSESIEDEMRVAIRHATAILLYRAQRINIPLLISSKFLQVVASHIHYYTKAREKLPADATLASIEEAVFKEYGSHTHTAMRGRTGNIRYFRHLAQALMPLLLPSDMLQSKMMCSLVQELFASKIFVPAMNFAAKPDFINKLLLVIFDKNSRLERAFGPPSRDVHFLSKWASARSRYSAQFRPLDLPLPELLESGHHLYTFMQFMKSLDDICVLQVYLTLNDLKQKVSSPEVSKVDSIISQVDDLYQTYFNPTSPNYLQLDSKEVAKISAVLSDETLTAMKKCEELKTLNVFGRLKGHIYHELLMKIYYPRFLHSYEFYEFYLHKKAEKQEENVKSRGDKWRQKTKRLKKYSQRSSSLDPQPGDLETLAEVSSSKESLAESCSQIPKTVKIIDADPQTDGIRPYTNYIIMTKMEGNTKHEVVKRRYKEFVGLDTKLRQFHGDIAIQLPIKKAFRNMDKGFVDARCKELEQYLTSLITYEGVLDSQILTSFLSSSSDPSLFLPDSMTGKMIKAVPSILKRDKIQHIDELLQTLLQVVELPSKQPSPQTLASVTAEHQTNSDMKERYLTAVADDLSDSGSSRYTPSSVQEPSTLPLQMKSVMDLLLYVSTSVYHVSPIQLTLLMLTKLLAQEAIEALTYNFVAGKVELLVTEAHVIRLIHIFRDNLFLSKDPPRSEEDIRSRFDETVKRLLGYPHPLVMGAIGERRFQEGTALIIEGLQCYELNKHLFFKLLDIILLELFPEMGESGDKG